MAGGDCAGLASSWREDVVVVRPRGVVRVLATGLLMDLTSVLVLIATPVLAFAGALVGHVLSRRGALELDRWRKREETMRMLRWATELATDRDTDRAEAGLTVLSALLDSPLLDRADVELVATIAASIALRADPDGDDGTGTGNEDADPDGDGPSDGAGGGMSVSEASTRSVHPSE
ncbi:MAG: hypothetical protein WA966_10870 [Ornithinimicrobium sp.]